MIKKCISSDQNVLSKFAINPMFLLPHHYP
jgi:hypothetical protein